MQKIEKCDTCSLWDSENNTSRNRLRCVFGCEEYKLEQCRKSFEYNRSVSGDNFDTEELYQHSTKVYGSGWKTHKEG